MTIALSLAAALIYGAADFFGGLAGRRVSTIAVVVWSQLMGLLLLVATLPFFPATPSASDFGWGALCGVCGALAVGLLYRGLAIGTMGVVSPVTAILAAVIPVLWGLERGERPSTGASLGIIAALVAVVCVSVAPSAAEHSPVPRRRAGLPPGILEALLAGFAFGLFFIALAQTHADAGLFPLASARLTSVGLAVVYAVITGVRAIWIGKGTLRLIAFSGILDMTANVLYIQAVHGGMLAIVAVLTSLYPAGTMALAAIVVRERLSRLQWIGVGMALLGVAAIALR